MQQSVAKDVAREIFYKEYLPDALSEAQLRSAAVLVLLGDEPREIPYLDALHISRDRIYSVENVHRTYNIQKNWKLGANLWYGDMDSFLRHALHHEQRFAVLNLDIEGGFRYNIDPSMTEVLLYCFTHPQTAIATYTTIGHDEYMLFEGVYSLVSLFWLAPRETEACVATLEKLYTQAGYENPFSMVLRDLFWIRSHMEHSCVATMHQLPSVTSSASVHLLFGIQNTIWQILKLVGKHPLRFGFLQEVMEAVNRHIVSEYLSADDAVLEENLPYIGIHMAHFKHLIYRGQHTWSQKCYFTMFERIFDDPVSVRVWTRDVLMLVTHATLTAIDQEGKRGEYQGVQHSVETKKVIWDKKTLYTKFNPRSISKKFYTPTPQLEAVSKGKLTKFGRLLVRSVASEGLTVAGIRSVLGTDIKGISDSVLRGFVTAARKKEL